MGHAVFVFGAAGAGKTTFCRNLREAWKQTKSIKLINLDPAQEDGADYDLDLCEFLTVKEVMNEADFGPNGALFYALEEMVDNIDELNLHEFEDDYFLFDCPGQIELFLHSNILQECVKNIQNHSKVAIVYLFDSSIFLNKSKTLFSTLCATISTFRFNLPVVSIISKADLIEKDFLEDILNKESLFEDQFDDTENGRLYKAISEYVMGNGMMDFYPLDWNDEYMVDNIFMILDNVLQYYDDADAKSKDINQ